MSDSLSSSNSSTTNSQVPKPCYGFFGREKKCTHENCKFSHDLEVYKKYYGLKDCPNSCGNFCKLKSNQCAKCYEKQPPRPCLFLFGYKKNCTVGDKCLFSHDPEVYMKQYGLVYCPNDCGNFCLETSKQCSSCVTELINAKKEERQNSRELVQCSGVNCEQFSYNKFCKACYEINSRYIINRRSPNVDSASDFPTLPPSQETTQDSY
jgi:hypothetical protein